MTELKDHVIIQQEGEDQIYTEEDVLNMPTEENVGEEVDHLVVETQVRIIMSLSNNSEISLPFVVKTSSYISFIDGFWGE